MDTFHANSHYKCSTSRHYVVVHLYIKWHYIVKIILLIGFFGLDLGSAERGGEKGYGAQTRERRTLAAPMAPRKMRTLFSSMFALMLESRFRFYTTDVATAADPVRHGSTGRSSRQGGCRSDCGAARL
ncbi:hypothetical protein M5E06_30710 [Azospirillum sp. A1-3]|uniref:hypothetical protein n=1 Tax=Azospirillum sp. A1-3 TaxID=185874 RepID=UPI002076F930|nr:hypothetical protein [Azospirillum sp. A1-3]MCM8738501.1 hypothetical protein [Azospirillum sp. A1-3]